MSTSRRAADRIVLPMAFWIGVDAVGLTPARLIAESALPLSTMHGGRMVLTTAQLFALWRAIGSLHPDPDVGIRLVLGVDLGQSHPVIVAARQARSFREAVDRLSRYKLLCGGEELRLQVSDEEVVIEPVWTFAAEAPPAALVDATFASIVELGRLGTGAQIRPKRLTLRHRGPMVRERADYFGVHARLGSPRNELVLRSENLDLPFTTRNSELAEILMPHFERQLSERQAETSTAHSVKLIVMGRLAGAQLSLAAVAKDLGMSVRSLQRHIESEGTTFRKILDEARQELARKYLADPGIGIAETAFLLGYQDANSFYRAFRNWEGTTPTHWRDTRETAR